MNKVMFNENNCLFFYDNKLYKEVEKIAIRLRVAFGFSNATLLPAIIKKYASDHDSIVKILHLPLKDNQLWGIFYNLDGIYFIVINSEISKNKQIVALAHEFYHLYSAIEENMIPYDILSADKEELNLEDKKANAFAACLLIPEDHLKVFLKNEEKTVLGKINQIKNVMDMFMVPYKTAVIRLIETEFFTKKEGLDFINAATREIRDTFELLCAKNTKWDFADNFIDLDDCDSLIRSNEDLELMSLKKLNKQKEIVNEIKKFFGPDKD